MSEPDLAILLTAANRCLADRLAATVAAVGGDAMRPSFGFVLRAVAAEQPTVSRLAALLSTRLRLSPTGNRIRQRALHESATIEDELRERFGGDAVGHLRAVLGDFVTRHGGAEELAAQRSRALNSW